MRLGQKIIVLVFLIMAISCGPGYKTGDSEIKRVSNIHDVTVIKKSKFKAEKESERRKEQRKVNRTRWKKQMSGR